MEAKLVGIVHAVKVIGIQLAQFHLALTILSARLVIELLQSRED